MAESKKTTAKKDTKKYPGKNFNNKAIEKNEKNALNLNVKVGKREPEVNATEEYLEEMRRKKEIIDDIVIIVSILVAILLFLSLFDLCGVIGGFFKAIMMGLMGPAVSFVFPFAFVFFVFFTRSNRGNPIATRKMIYFWSIVVLSCGLINLLMGFADNFEWSSFTSKQGGGGIGELISCPLYALFGNIAAILILVTLILVCIMLITGKAIIHAIRKKRAEQKAIMRQIEEEEREEEERRIEAEKKRKPANPTYNEFRQMSLDDIQEENRRKKLVLVDVEGTSESGEGLVYDRPKRKKKPSIIDKLKGYGHKKPEKQETMKEQEFVPYQPLVTHTSNVQVPTYQSELDKKFNSAAPVKNDNILQNSGTYEEDMIPSISGNHGYTFTEEPEQPSVKPYVPPVEEHKPYSESFTNGAIGERDNEHYESLDAVKEAASAGANEKPQSPSSSANVSAASAAVTSVKKPEKIDLSDATIEEIDETTEKPYIFPSINLLRRPDRNQATMSTEELKETAAKLKNTLHSFGVNVTITNFTSGPNVTRYELQPEIGTKVSRITALQDDIKLNLAAEDIRIEAPIPGKSAVGIEVPNTKGSTVYIRSLLESERFVSGKGKILFAVGKDIAGDTVVTDIAKMPHVLIAGATGSGKSVCINTIIMSVLYKYEPKDVRLIMIDPKVVELSVYNGIPHLLIPVVTDPKKAYGALNWAVQEMMDRYKRFSELEVRDIEGYNEKVRTSTTPLLDNEGNERAVLPQILIIVDEMADLMMVSPGEVEEAICRLAQLARAAGIHLVLATQRPTVNVITGLIKANVPSRIAFAVSSATDSRTILDQMGAEKLLGKGDMLFFPTGIPKPIRVQGAFVSDDEVKAVVNEIKLRNSGNGSYSDKISEQIDRASVEGGKKGGSASDNSGNDSDHDEYFAEAGRFIIEKDKASIGLLQRMYKIGFNRAARIMDQLAEAGVVGPEEGTKPRTILMSQEQFENYLEQNGG